MSTLCDVFFPRIGPLKLTDSFSSTYITSCSKFWLDDPREVVLKSSSYFNCRRLAKQNILELKDLQKEVKRSRSDAQRYLNLGWIGVCEMLAERDMAMNNVMDLWQKFRSFLLLLQHFYLKLEKILILWEKALYLVLLYLLFSEFPNTLRPPCTTMPWIIWPSLVVLWGVCWMFYEELSWNWGDQGVFPTTCSMIEPFEDIGHTDPPQEVDFDFGDISCNMLQWDAPRLDVPNSEQQLLLLSEPSHSVTYNIGTCLDSTKAPSANLTEATSPLVLNHGKIDGVVATPKFSSSPTNTIRSATETRPLEAVESIALEPTTPLVHRHPRSDQAGPSRNSKHGQTEKYLCTYPGCIHSQLGSGFKRKDHLDQHLRGPHKQASVQRLRAKPEAASSVGNPTATSDAAGAPLPTKKRKRGSEEEVSASNSSKLKKELAEERRLRQIAEEDNRLLRLKLENYERRMEKYEERLDRMMNLWEEHKGDARM